LSVGEADASFPVGAAVNDTSSPSPPVERGDDSAAVTVLVCNSVSVGLYVNTSACESKPKPTLSIGGCHCVTFVTELW